MRKLAALLITLQCYAMLCCTAVNMGHLNNRPAVGQTSSAIDNTAGCCEHRKLGR